MAQAVNVLWALILIDREKTLLPPSYHIFDLYQVHQNATLIHLKFESPDYALGDEKTFALNALVSRDKAGVVHLPLVNFDPTKTLILEISLPGSNWKAVTGRILTATNVSDYNTFDKPQTVPLTAFTDAKKQGDKLRVALPPYPVVMLELK